MVAAESLALAGKMENRVKKAAALVYIILYGTNTAVLSLEGFYYAHNFNLIEHLRIKHHLLLYKFWTLLLL